MYLILGTYRYAIELSRHHLLIFKTIPLHIFIVDYVGGRQEIQGLLVQNPFHPKNLHNFLLLLLYLQHIP